MLIGLKLYFKECTGLQSFHCTINVKTLNAVINSNQHAASSPLCSVSSPSIFTANWLWSPSQLMQLIFNQHYESGRAKLWSHELYYLGLYFTQSGKCFAFPTTPWAVSAWKKGSVCAHGAPPRLLFKQWITKRAQGIMALGEQRVQRRFAYPLCRRNK